MTVRLTSMERKVLTACDDTPVGDPSVVAGRLGLPIKTVVRALQKFLAAGLLEAIELDEMGAFYSHTRKVTREMLDDEAHYNFGVRPRYLYATEQAQK